MFRPVTLPEGVSGRLFLHSMPGRFESFQEARQQMAGSGIARIVCLSPFFEVERKAPEYAKALEQGSLPCALERFPVCDYGVPDDWEGFWLLVQRVAEVLRAGEHVLVHCAGGIGRTGMFAICVLMALGLRHDKAARTVHEAGSRPGDECQKRLVDWVAQKKLGQD